MSDTDERAGTNITNIRAAAGLTLAELSDRLTDEGHPRSISTLSKLERGAQSLTLNDLTAIAAALKVGTGLILSENRICPECGQAVWE